MLVSGLTRYETEKPDLTLCEKAFFSSSAKPLMSIQRILGENKSSCGFVFIDFSHKRNCNGGILAACLSTASTLTELT